MKSITLLYDTRGFQSAEASGKLFSLEELRKECLRQALLGSQDIVLRVILHVQRFVVIPDMAGDEAFFSCHFPSHGSLTSNPLGDTLQKIVYEVPEGLHEQLSHILPKCHILPDCALMARYAMNQSSLKIDLGNGYEDTLIIYCPDENLFNPVKHNETVTLSIFLASHGSLIFANAFQVGSLEEVRYFVMAVKQKFCNGDGCVLCSYWGSMPAVREILQPFFESIEEKSLVAEHSEPFLGLFSDIII